MILKGPLAQRGLLALASWGIVRFIATNIPPSRLRRATSLVGRLEFKDKAYVALEPFFLCIHLRCRPNNRRRTGTRKCGGRITVIFILFFHAFLRRPSLRQIPLFKVYAVRSFAFIPPSFPLGIFSNFL